MTRTLLVAAIAWPALLGAVVALRAADRAPWLTGAVYLAAARICHQDPARSFATAGVQWPVCGRCSGLYLAAPLGALFAAGWRRRRSAGLPIAVMLVAAAPTAATMIWEWAGQPMSSLTRLLAALPLGALVAFLLVRVTREPARAIG